METQKSQHILIVDDHPLVRRGLADVIRGEFKNAHIGEAQNAHDALQRVWSSSWDVIILDVSMPGRSGLDVLKEIRQSSAKTPVLILSTHSEDQFALRSYRSGASGYLTKETAPTELVVAIRKVLGGGKYVRQSVAEKIASHMDDDTDKLPHEKLSDREFEVLCMIGSGKTVKEIGAELSLSVKTISTYRCRILEKMKMRNNAELMNYALRHGLVRIGEASPTR